jgi:hypothetical protein
MVYNATFNIYFCYIVAVSFIGLWHIKELAVFFLHNLGAVVVMIVRYMDLQLPMQSVPIITKVVNLNSVHGKVYSIQHYS